jgi:hypothetical protein
MRQHQRIYSSMAFLPPLQLALPLQLRNIPLTINIEPLIQANFSFLSIQLDQGLFKGSGGD